MFKNCIMQLSTAGWRNQVRANKEGLMEWWGWADILGKTNGFRNEY